MVDKTYVELDCLLDTRMATIASMGEGWSEKLAASSEYFHRLDDKFDSIFPDFPQTRFEELYKNRTIETIEGRVCMTGLIDRLSKYRKSVGSYGATLPDPQSLSLVVNYYPYKLDEKSKEELATVLSEVTGINNVRLCSLLPDFLTPGYLRNNFTEFIVYDFDAWLNIHHEELGKNPLPRVQAIMPLIRKQDYGLPIKEVIAEVRRELCPVIDISPLPLDVFSFKV